MPVSRVRPAVLVQLQLQLQQTCELPEREGPHACSYVVGRNQLVNHHHRGVAVVLHEGRVSKLQGPAVVRFAPEN